MRSIVTALSSMVVLAGGLSAAQAAVVPVTQQGGGPATFIMAGMTYGGSTTNDTAVGTHAFDDGITFTSLTGFILDTTFLTTLVQPSTIKDIAYALYMGTYKTGTLIATITPDEKPNKKGATGDYTSGALSAGSYYFELSGHTMSNSSVTNQVTFSVSAVPLPGALPMFGAALLALGGVAFARSRKGSDANAALPAAVG